MKNIHFKTAFSSMRRSPFQALAAIFVLTITFLMTTILTVLVYSSNRVIRYFETQPQVIAFLVSDATPVQISTLKSRLESDVRVKNVKYVSKEEALSYYKDATSDNPLLAELVSPSIFPASIEFSLVDLKFVGEILDEVKRDSIVDQVGFTASLGDESTLESTVDRLKNITWYLRIGGTVFTGMLLFVSFAVLTIVIGMRFTTRRKEVEILQLIGATSGFIRKPLVIEAITYSVLGVVLGWLVGVIILLYLSPAVIAYFAEIPFLPRNTIDFFKVLSTVLAGEMVVGIVLALLGSFIAVSRAHKAR